MRDRPTAAVPSPLPTGGGVRGGVRLEAGEAEQFRAPQGLVRQAMRRYRSFFERMLALQGQSARTNASGSPS